MSNDELVQDIGKKCRSQLSKGILELLILMLIRKDRHGLDISELVWDVKK